MNARIASLSLFVAVVSLGIGLSVGHMRELGAANVDVPSLVAASESASSPAASAAPADDGGFLGLLMTGKYLPAVGAFLILFVAGLRSVLALRVAWFATKVGGYALGFGSAVLLYLGAAWQSGAGITVGLFAAALGAGWAAAGGWEHLMDLVDWMRSKKPTVQPTAIVLVTTLACLIMGGAVVQACGPVKQAGQAIIDCTKADAAQTGALLDELKPLLAGDMPSWSAIEAKANDAGATIGGCVLAQLVQGYLGGFKAMPYESAWDAHRALEDFRRNVAGGATFHTSKGDL